MEKFFNQSSFKILTAFLLLTAFACAQKPVWSKQSASAGGFSFLGVGNAKPDWIMSPAKDPANFYFVGMNSGAESLDQGQDAAIKSAMGKIANYLGTRIESISEQNVTETEQNLKLQIRAKSKAKVQGASVEDWFAEKNNAGFDVYVLVKIPKSQIGRELSRQEREKSDRANTAYDLYLLGKEKEEQKNYHGAKGFYEQALGVLQELEDIVSLPRGEMKNSSNLRALLRTAQQNASIAARQLALSVKVNGPEGAHQVFDSSLSSILEKSGFNRNRQQAAIEISGEVSALESGFVLNSYIFYAEGSLSALRKSDHQVIGTVPFKTKAFGSGKTKAAFNALTQSAREAGHSLAQILLQEELNRKSATCEKC